MEIRDKEKRRLSFPIGPYWFVALLLIALAWYCSVFPGCLLKDLRSEYKPVEVLSKFVILLSFAVSVYGYRLARNIRTHELSIAFIMLSAAMYFGESNFIHTSIQPVMGLALGIVIVRNLWKNNRGILWSFIAFGLAIFLGAVADVIDDLIRLGHWDTVVGIEPGRIILGFAHFEEVYELIGGFFLLQTCLQAFIGEIDRVKQKHASAMAVIAAGLFFIAVGNSMLHFQYSPSVLLRVAGCLLSYIGFFGIIYANSYLLNQEQSFSLGAKTGFYAVFFGCLVVLPTVHAEIPQFMSVILWLPVFAVLFWKAFLTKGGFERFLSSAVSDDLTDEHKAPSSGDAN